MATLQPALDALKQSQLGVARDLLVAAWKVSRSGVVAEAITVLDARAPDSLSRLLEAAVKTSVSKTAANLAGFANDEDPRVATWALRVLTEPPFTSSSSRPFFEEVAAVVIRLRDPRLVQALPLIRQVSAARISPPPYVVDRLEEAAKTLVLTQSTAEEQALSVAMASLGAPQTEEALVAAVYARPDDDHVRQVLADLWLERGDPRGEFTSLQLARGRHGEPGAREKKLLVAGRAKWLGPLQTVLGPESTFERGFISMARFLAKARADTKAARRLLSLVDRDDAWATVEELFEGGWEYDHLLSVAPLRALRHVRVDDSSRLALERRVDPLVGVTSVNHCETASPTLVPLPTPIALFARCFPSLTKLTLSTFPERLQVNLEGIEALKLAQLELQLMANTDEGQAAVEKFIANVPSQRAWAQQLTLVVRTLPGGDPTLTTFTRTPSGFVRAQLR